MYFAKLLQKFQGCQTSKAIPYTHHTVPYAVWGGRERSAHTAIPSFQRSHNAHLLLQKIRISTYFHSPKEIQKGLFRFPLKRQKTETAPSLSLPAGPLQRLPEPQARGVAPPAPPRGTTRSMSAPRLQSRTLSMSICTASSFISSSH